MGIAKSSFLRPALAVQSNEHDSSPLVYRRSRSLAWNLQKILNSSANPCDVANKEKHKASPKDEALSLRVQIAAEYHFAETAA